MGMNMAMDRERLLKLIGAQTVTVNMLQETLQGMAQRLADAEKILQTQEQLLAKLRAKARDAFDEAQQEVIEAEKKLQEPQEGTFDASNSPRPQGHNAQAIQGPSSGPASVRRG